MVTDDRYIGALDMIATASPREVDGLFGRDNTGAVLGELALYNLGGAEFSAPLIDLASGEPLGASLSVTSAHEDFARYNRVAMPDTGTQRENYRTGRVVILGTLNLPDVEFAGTRLSDADLANVRLTFLNPKWMGLMLRGKLELPLLPPS